MSTFLMKEEKKSFKVQYGTLHAVHIDNVLWKQQQQMEFQTNQDKTINLSILHHSNYLYLYINKAENDFQLLSS